MGTIALNAGATGSPAEFEPPEEAIRLLNKLADDPRNQVWVLSGLTKKMLDVVAEKAPKLGFV